MTLQQIKKGRISPLAALCLIIILAVVPTQAFGAMANYCAIPPFVSTGTVQPNLLFMLDLSGSMAFFANNTSTNPTSCSGTGWSASQTYNGYFDPTKTYYCDSVNSSGATECSTTTGGIWHEAGATTCAPVNCTGNAGSNSDTTGTKLCVTNATACGINAGKYGSGLSTKTTTYFNCGYTSSKPYGCCTNPPTNTAGDCGASNSGNCLNFLHMTRSDIVRWAMTGGAPKNCSSNQYDPTYCDPEVWNTTAGSPNVGKVCNNSINIDSAGTSEGGCILQSIDNTLVSNSWDRINSAIIQNLETLPTQPRMGVAFFSASATALLGPKVYIGDYACQDSSYLPSALTPPVDASHPWTKGCYSLSYDSSFKSKNLITYVNSAAPGGGTNTGPALKAALDYFTNTALATVPSATATSTGFFTASETSATPTDKWRNPLYKCDYNSSGSLVCTPYPCASNFVLLMSDGGWNTPDCTSATAGADPVQYSYAMHYTGFTNPMSLLDVNDDKKSTVTAVYTTAMFPDGVCVKSSNNTVPSSGTQLCNTTTPCPSGYWCAGGTTSLENIAMYGSFTGSAAYPGGTSGLPAGTATDNANGSSGTLKGTYLGSCGTTGPTIKGSEVTPIPTTSSVDWDKQGPAAGGLPDTFSAASDANTIKTTIQNAVLEIVARAASGAAASVLASGDGSGANIVQSIFYPRCSISSQPLIGWTSTLQNLWYYLDPISSQSNMRENTDDTGSVYELNLDMDRILQFEIDGDQTMARLFNVNANGQAVGTGAAVDPSTIKSLWEAGLLLWNKDPNTRKIYTNLSTSTISPPTAFAGMTEFRADATANNLSVGSPTLETLLNTDSSTRTSGDNTTVAKNLVSYVRGVSTLDGTTVTPGSGSPIVYRNRTTKIDLNGNGNVTDTNVTMPFGGSSWKETPAQVWKLGDIINSTPRIESWIHLNDYDTYYGDKTYSAFLKTDTYKKRGMVFVGSNDGMLHAFKLGTLDLSPKPGMVRAQLCDTTSGTDANGNYECGTSDATQSNMGSEQWGFIPSSALPYLQYLTDANYDYCHLYYIDGTPFMFDASIEAPGQPSTGNYWSTTRTTSSWRTILIGNMRFGGGCSPKYCASTASPAVFTATQCSTDADCSGGNTCQVKPFTVGTPAKGIGYSSYFALDVTDPTSPQFLWEYTNPSLGFSTTGPAVVKILNRVAGTTASTPDRTSDGKWFVVLASGPTGPIDSLNFKGFSNQNLKFFILDLKTGTLLRTIDTGIANAFGGSLHNAPFDFDIDYQDDAVYMGFTKAEDSTLTDDIWNQGGVIRLVTRKKLSGNDVSATGNTALNPANWEWGYVFNNIGPVTAAVGHLAHYPAVGNTPDLAFLFFGSGRYFYPFDDPSTQQAIYGVNDPCLTNMMDITKINNLAQPVCNDNSHGTATACANSDTKPPTQMIDPATCLKDATSNPPTSPSTNGWFINLYNHVAGDTQYNERMITDPLAANNGAIYYTTLAPSTDPCSFGGFTYIWGVKYDTAQSIGSSISGLGLIQTSTSAINSVQLQTIFGDPTSSTYLTDPAHKGGRRSASIQGVPPLGAAFQITVPPSPTNKALHVKEK